MAFEQLPVALQQRLEKMFEPQELEIILQEVGLDPCSVTEEDLEIYAAWLTSVKPHNHAIPIGPIMQAVVSIQEAGLPLDLVVAFERFSPSP